MKPDLSLCPLWSVVDGLGEVTDVTVLGLGE